MSSACLRNASNAWVCMSLPASYEQPEARPGGHRVRGLQRQGAAPQPGLTAPLSAARLRKGLQPICLRRGGGRLAGHAGPLGRYCVYCGDIRTCSPLSTGSRPDHQPCRRVRSGNACMLTCACMVTCACTVEYPQLRSAGRCARAKAPQSGRALRLLPHQL